MLSSSHAIAAAYRLSPPAVPFENPPVAVPGSKSLTNRALLLAALAGGKSVLENILFSDDTRRMIEALQALGVPLEVSEPDQRATVEGQGGRLPARDENASPLFLGNAGTAYRFLTAACCLGAGSYCLEGVARMRERPIGQLVDALRQLGATIDYLEAEGYPPIRIHAAELGGGTIDFPRAVSSQYISALLQIAPCLPDGVELHFDGPITSRPYVEMTARLMHRFGATVEDPRGATPRLRVAGRQGYTPAYWTVEPDASNAGYFLAAAALVPGAVCTIDGIGDRSMQGDAWFAECLRRMGATVHMGQQAITVVGPDRLQAIEADLGEMPDMAQTLAVVALFAEGTTVIRGIGNLRVKETDRIAALDNELTRLGAAVTVDAHDNLTIQPPRRVMPTAIDTYDDHRMAMSFALVGLRTPDLVINNPGCVVKTFPDYFDQLQHLGMGVEPVS